VHHFLEWQSEDGDSEDVFLLLFIQRICYEWLFNLIGKCCAMVLVAYLIFLVWQLLIWIYYYFVYIYFNYYDYLIIILEKYFFTLFHNLRNRYCLGVKTGNTQKWLVRLSQLFLISFYFVYLFYYFNL
jgi:hypothetical protein